MSEKIEVLAKFLECEQDEISECRYDRHGIDTFEHGRSEYSVATDEESDQAAKESITESLWAFRKEFLSYETELPKDVFEALQNKYEDSNETVKKLIEKTCGIDHFVESAISADGRGHFLSGYDGEENEITVNGKTYFIYKN